MKIDGTLKLTFVDEGDERTIISKNTVVNGGIDLLVSALAGDITLQQMINNVRFVQQTNPPATRKIDTLPYGSGGSSDVSGTSTIRLQNRTKKTSNTLTYTVRIPRSSVRGITTVLAFYSSPDSSISAGGTMFSRVVLTTPLDRTGDVPTLSDISLTYDLTFS